jgi:hypothetical protein
MYADLHLEGLALERLEERLVFFRDELPSSARATQRERRPSA